MTRLVLLLLGLSGTLLASDNELPRVRRLDPSHKARQEERLQDSSTAENGNGLRRQRPSLL